MFSQLLRSPNCYILYTYSLLQSKLNIRTLTVSSQQKGNYIIPVSHQAISFEV